MKKVKIEELEFDVNIFNPKKFKIAMIEADKSVYELADVIKKSRVSFDKKRSGKVTFDIKEIIVLSHELSLDLEQVNDIFFGGHLHDGNYQRVG